jgi:hypothetical protein
MSYQQTYEHFLSKSIIKTLCKGILINIDNIDSDINETAQFTEQLNWILQSEAKKAHDYRVMKMAKLAKPIKNQYKESD